MGERLSGIRTSHEAFGETDDGRAGSCRHRMAPPLPCPPLVRISLRAIGSARCLPAASLTGSAGLARADLSGLVVVPVTVLTPPPPPPSRRRRSQLVHSAERIETTLVSLRNPVRRRSSIRTRP